MRTRQIKHAYGHIVKDLSSDIRSHVVPIILLRKACILSQIPEAYLSSIFLHHVLHNSSLSGVNSLPKQVEVANVVSVGMKMWVMLVLELFCPLLKNLQEKAGEMAPCLRALVAPLEDTGSSLTAYVVAHHRLFL